MNLMLADGRRTPPLVASTRCWGKEGTRAMSINEIMKAGTNGMSKAEKAAEQERRLKVSLRINLLGNRVDGGKTALRMCEKGSAEAKKLNAQIRVWERELAKIKRDESVWLKKAAWFMYC